MRASSSDRSPHKLAIRFTHMEYLFTDLNVVSRSGISQASILVTEYGVRAGSSAVLTAVPEHQDRSVVDASGTFLMPAITDHLSWVSSRFRESDLSEQRLKLNEGGVATGYFEVWEPVSRVAWLDVGRRVKRAFGGTYGLYGHQSYITRWKQLEGTELPPIKPLLSVDMLKDNRDIALCPAQEHRASHVQEDSPAVKLWWMNRHIELIQEEIGDRTLTQEVINDVIAAPEREKELISQIGTRDVQKIGTTLEADTPFLANLLLDRRVNQGLLGIPLRSHGLVNKLVSDTISRNFYRIAVGDYPLDWEIDEINGGFDIGGFALPLLLSAYRSYDIGEVFRKLAGFDPSSTSEPTGGVLFEKPGIFIPDNFVLISKGGKRTLQSTDTKLDPAFRTPDYSVRHTVIGRRLLFSRD